MNTSKSLAIAPAAIGTLRPTRAASPLAQVLGPGAKFQTLSDAQMNCLRRHVIDAAPVRPGSALELFLWELFVDDQVVLAYFRPTALQLSASSRIAAKTLPFEHAVRAADRAASLGSLPPHERMLAWVAAFVWPCGIFYENKPAANAARRTEALFDTRDATRACLLERALRQLRQRDAALGQTLAAVLDAAGSDSADADQLARVASAVYLGCLEIQRLWALQPQR